MASPMPEVMDRSVAPPSTSKGLFARLCCPFTGQVVTTAGTRHKRQEQVFYDSAKAQRTECGKLHYCLACPGWSKVTTARVVYSRWDLIPISKVPGQCCAICCNFGGSDADWLPPDPSVMRTPSGDGECSVPCGRTLDTFDSDIIVDASAHQTLCQVEIVSILIIPTAPSPSLPSPAPGLPRRGRPRALPEGGCRPLRLVRGLRASRRRPPV